MSFMSASKKRAWANNELEGVDIEKQWIRHLNSYRLRFPRDVGLFPDRYPVRSQESFIDEIQRNKSGHNCYTNTFSKPMIQGSVFDTFYVDLDAEIGIEEDDDLETKEAKFDESISDMYWEVKKMVHYTSEEFDYIPRVYFSGGRGFSVYFDFPVQNVPFAAVVAAVKDILREADVDFDSVDTSVWEDNRLSRLPYTLNWNNVKKRHMDPLLCLPIDPEWPERVMLSEIKDPEVMWPVMKNPSAQLGREIKRLGEMEEYDVEVILEEDENQEFRAGDNPEKALDEIQKLMNAAPYIRDGRKRIIHMVLVPNLIEAGFPRKEVHNMCQDFVKRTKANPSHYEREVRAAINRTIRGPDNHEGQWKAWSFEKFLIDNDDLLEYFDRDNWTSD